MCVFQLDNPDEQAAQIRRELDGRLQMADQIARVRSEDELRMREEMERTNIQKLYSEQDSACEVPVEQLTDVCFCLVLQKEKRIKQLIITDYLHAKDMEIAMFDQRYFCIDL